MAISNDREFKAAFAVLPAVRQWQVGARADVSDAELTAASQTAHGARVESSTQCGRETDWSAQAGHFVAKAAVACVRPAQAGDNLAWEAAMQARMARTCNSVAEGEGTANREAEEQYRVLEAFLNS